MNGNMGIIGKRAEISCAGSSMSGTIIDETKNTIVIETQKGAKTMLKKTAIITINGKRIYGKNIMKRPEDRIKG